MSSSIVTDESPARVVGFTVMLGDTPILLTKDDAWKLLYTLLDHLGFKFESRVVSDEVH